MRIQEMMTRDLVLVAPDETVTSAAEKMAREDTGALPVCVGTEVKGVVTDRDIVVRCLAKHLDPEVTLVARCMTEEVHTIYEDEDVQVAADKMEAEQIRRLLVLNRDNALVGIVSLGDLSGELSDSEAGRVVEGISEPASNSNAH